MGKTCKTCDREWSIAFFRIYAWGCIGFLHRCFILYVELLVSQSWEILQDLFSYLFLCHSHRLDLP